MNRFEYQKLSQEEMSQRHILGRLVGIMADYKHPTRNGRLYSKEAWENQINSDLFKEAIENKTVLAELEHPDRTDIDPKQACACLAELKICEDGYIRGIWDILDLPNGQIVKTLCDYGTKIGISSRGTGDVQESFDGDYEEVTPDSFFLSTFDLVLTPSVQKARLDLVTESMGGRTLKESLDKTINSAKTEADKQIMKEAMTRIEKKIDAKSTSNSAKLNEDTIKSSINNGQNSAKSSDIKSESIAKKSKDSNETVNEGSDETLKNLQETLKENEALKAEKLKLQEKLAISDTKVNSLNEEVERLKSSTINLSSRAREAKKLSQEISTLNEELKKKDSIISFKNATIKKMNESKKNITSNSESLNESISNKDKEIVKLNESLAEQKKKYEDEIKSLNEKLAKCNSSEEMKKLQESVAHNIKVAGSYKKLATEAMNKYIAKEALMLGVSANEIKNRLPDKFSMGDVERVCENMKDYALNIESLPFRTNRQVGVKINESKKDKLAKSTNPEDEVSPQLMKMANLNK